MHTITIVDQNTDETLTIAPYTPWEDVRDALATWFEGANGALDDQIEDFARAIVDYADGSELTYSTQATAEFLGLTID